jgi:predicted HicB family RNase H-like nuclease
MKKLPKIDHYIYRITWSEDDNQYVGLCAEFPSLSYLASTPQMALRGILSVVTEVVKDMASNNETIPEPLNSRHYSGKFMVRVPPEVHRQLVIQAAEEHISLNRLVSSKLS